MNEIEPEKLLKLTQLMAAHLDSDYVSYSWNDNEKASGWMMICWVMNLIEID